jgi:hypothetical protein
MCVLLHIEVQQRPLDRLTQPPTRSMTTACALLADPATVTGVSRPWGLLGQTRPSDRQPVLYPRDPPTHPPAA